MEEVELGETPEDNIKQIEIIEENNNYKLQFEIIDQYLHVYIYDNNIIKYKGYIHIVNIQYNLGVYKYDIKDIFNDIYKLNNDKFKLIKDINKYKLQIKFIIFNKMRYININLYDNNTNDNNYINEINALKVEIKRNILKLKLLQEKRKLLQEKFEILKKYEDDTYKNFNIKDKVSIHIIKYDLSSIRCSTILKDGRFVTCDGNGKIIIYNNKTYQPVLTIKEHNDYINDIIQLSSGELVSCSDDNTIKIYNINKNNIQIIQTLKEHKDRVNKIIELKNKQLVSCSFDNSIIFYHKDSNNKYIKDYSISTNGWNGPIIQTKDNEICYYEKDNDTICFYDLIKKNNIKKINDINATAYTYDNLLMMSKDLLLIGGENIISIVNVNSYNIVRTIKISDSGNIFATLMLNKDMILTGDENGRLIQWKIENDNLKIISKKENAHDDRILSLTKLGNGHILSSDLDKTVKIW